MFEKIIIAAVSAVLTSFVISTDLSSKLSESLRLLHKERENVAAIHAQVDKLKASNNFLLEKINILKSRIDYFISMEPSEDLESDDSINIQDEIAHEVSYLSIPRYNLMDSRNSSFLDQSHTDFRIPSYFEAYGTPEPDYN